MPEAMTPEAISDEALLRRYAEAREPEAFAELARRHAGLVYGTCLRITSSPQDAEELAQDCFLQLARKAGEIRTSVAGWLHRLATHRALNSLRARGRRLRREAQAAREAPPTPDDASPWEEIEPLLDEAIAELPEALRAAIVMHFLEEQPQSAVAERLGIDQSTVSRRIKEGLAKLQRKLRRSGVVLSGMPLATLIPAHAPQASPQPDLFRSLGKIALAAGAAAPPAAVKLPAWGMAALAAFGPVLVQLVAGGWHGFLTALAVALYIGLRRPAWFDEFTSSFGSSGRDRDFSPLKRWTWTTPPAHWPQALAKFLASGSILAGMGTTSLLAKPDVPGIAAMTFLFSLLHLATAARIILRVLAHRSDASPRQSKPDPAPPNAGDIAQAFANATVGTTIAASVALLAVRIEDARLHFGALAVFMTIAMLWCWGDAASKVVRRRKAAAIRGAIDELNPPTPAAPPKAATGIILYLLATAALFTASALAQHLGLVQTYPSSPTTAATQREVAVGLLPNLSLLLLIGMARALARAHPSIAPAARLALAAIASLCAITDIALIASWLLGISW